MLLWRSVEGKQVGICLNVREEGIWELGNSIGKLDCLLSMNHGVECRCGHDSVPPLKDLATSWWGSILSWVWSKWHCYSLRCSEAGPVTRSSELFAGWLTSASSGLSRASGTQRPQWTLLSPTDPAQFYYHTLLCLYLEPLTCSFQYSLHLAQMSGTTKSHVFQGLQNT